ncbi:NAD-dependent epimerase/dehydratase family protein [Thalassococcus sp. BH17M4-6]|uniref:NAD-dependent epimerase/dehydratase family protein n=1 Tax=Thalassococcus sp. BH17M4-6 TaxID=3413148 RepID=UPI003BC6E0CB
MAQKTQALRVLVLGANGKIGKMICPVLRAHGEEPLAIRTVARSLQADLVWKPGDPLADLPDSDAVVALWGVTPSHGGDLADNTALAICAMEIGQAVGADRVLHTSTAAVYATDGQVATETDVLRPGSDYGRAKRDMESALWDWQRAQDSGPKPVVLRIGNVVGADSLFAAIGRGGTVTLDRFENGTGPRRSYIAPGDLAGSIAALCHAPAGDLEAVYNIAAPDVTEMAALAMAAGAVVAWQPAPDTAVPVVALETTRLQRLYAMPARSADATWQVADWRRWQAAA